MLPEGVLDGRFCVQFLGLYVGTRDGLKLKGVGSERLTVDERREEGTVQGDVWKL